MLSVIAVENKVLTWYPQMHATPTIYDPVGDSMEAWKVLRDKNSGDKKTYFRTTTLYQDVIELNLVR